MQNKLVWNLVASACKGIKLQPYISSTWSLLSHTEAWQNYSGDWLTILIQKRNKLKISSRIHIASQLKHTSKLFRLQYFVFWVLLTKEERKPCSLSGQKTSLDKTEKVPKDSECPHASQATWSCLVNDKHVVNPGKIHFRPEEGKCL